MHKIYLGVFILAMLLLGAGVYVRNTGHKTTGNIIEMRLEGKDVKLLVADEQSEWIYGLMNRRSLPEADGMIFMFPDKQMRSFWNMNTLMNLRVLWMDGSSLVGVSELPSIEESKETVTVHSPAPVDRVIELVK